MEITTKSEVNWGVSEWLGQINLLILISPTIDIITFDDFKSR